MNGVRSPQANRPRGCFGHGPAAADPRPLSRQRVSPAAAGIIGAPVVDGVDDLSAVDSLQVDRRYAEVAVPELALDHVERDAFAGHLDGMRVA